MRQHHADNSHPRSGAAAVEFAAVLPLLTALVLGMIDIGQAFSVQEIVTNASRSAARRAVRDDIDSLAQVRAIVEAQLQASLPNLGADSLAASLNVTARDGDGVAVADLTSVGSGAPLTVDVDLQFNAVRWIRGVPIMDGRTLSASTTMRRD